jgi:hypothetical protein
MVKKRTHMSQHVSGGAAKAYVHTRASQSTTPSQERERERKKRERKVRG